MRYSKRSCWPLLSLLVAFAVSPALGQDPSSPMNGAAGNGQFGGADRTIFNNQVGRLDARAQYYTTRPFVDYRDLLPAAPNNNFFIENPFGQTPRLGSGYAAASGFLGLQNIYNRLGGNVNVGGVYDTGFLAGRTPSGIAVDGSAAARGRGVFNMSPFEESRLIWDVGTTETSASTPQTQGYAELEYVDGQLEARSLFGRMVNGFSGEQVTAGKQQSFMEDRAAIPKLLTGDVVGSMKSDNFAINYTRQYMNWTTGVAIENPRSDFQTVSATDVQLSRYPLLAGRLRYLGDNLVDRFQISCCVQWLGVEDVAGVEEWTSGWGVGIVGRKLVIEDTLVWYYGAAGGDGIGSHIIGVEAAAANSLGQLESVDGFGAYSGLSLMLLPGDGTKPLLWTNALIGYSHQSGASGIDPTTTRRARQIATNVIYRPSENYAIGLEYNYMDRDIHSGDEGSNSRIQIFVIFTTTDEASSSRAGASIQALSEGRDGTMYLRGL